MAERDEEEEAEEEEEEEEGGEDPKEEPPRPRAAFSHVSNPKTPSITTHIDTYILD